MSSSARLAASFVTGSGSSSASSSSSGSDMDDVPDTRRYNLATNTPVSRRLWQER